MCAFFAFRLQFKWFNCSTVGWGSGGEGAGKSIAAAGIVAMSSFLASCHSGKSGTGTGTAALRIRHVALSVELFVGFVLHLQSMSLCVSNVWQPNERSRTTPFAHSPSPFPLPSPCLLRFVSYSLQLHGCHSKLSRKRKLLCKHFAAPFARARQAWRIRNAKVK